MLKRYIVFILIVRAYINQENIKQGFLMALKDERISSSLKSMHEFPEKEWTIEQLATKDRMSRSLYCKEFKRSVGETPLGPPDYESQTLICCLCFYIERCLARAFEGRFKAKLLQFLLREKLF